MDKGYEVTQLISRRRFLKHIKKMGLMTAVMGLTGWPAGGGSSTPLSQTAEGEILPGRPYHHTAEGFRNPMGSATHEHSLTNLLKHIWHELSRNDPEVPQDHFIGQDQAVSNLDAMGNGDKITWLGHSSFLLRLSGTNILIDPFLSDYATSFPPFGPRRYTPPGLSVEKLPKIDVIIISHNHYDHMDSATLKALPHRHNIRIIVPLKLGKICKELGYKKVTELDWLDTKKSGPITITSLPAVHFSGRSLSDRNKTLWTGYSINSRGTKIYFSGDTAYHSLFKKIGRNYGPFDYGLVPIGAYRPHPMKNYSHTTPEQAVKLGLDLKINTMIPIHWGSLVLSQAPVFDAPARFLEAGRKAGYTDLSLWKMKIGETRQMG